MPRLAGLTLLASLVAAGPTRAQELQALRAEIALRDFGIDAADSIAWGRVAVVHGPVGPHLEVHHLTSTPPVTRPDLHAARSAEAEPLAGAGPAMPSALSDGAASAGAGALASLWVWNTAELTSDGAERATFLDFVEAEGIDRIFLQLTPAPGLTASAGFVPFDGAALGPLVAELRARGALTYALDGDPEYGRPENHRGVARTVARVAEHNRDVPAEQRFHGVRYDVEPYLLPGFQGPARLRILRDYVRLLETVAAAAGADLAFGVDIPFWLDGLDEVTGERWEVDLEDGVRVPVLVRILELVDDVAVMAYRTSATGPGGVLALTGGELLRARKRSVEVFVGIETSPLPDEERYTIRSAGRAGLPPAPDSAWVVMQERGGGRASVWLVDGAAALDALSLAAGGAESTLTHWPAGTPVPLTGAQLSFHGLGPETVRRVAAELSEGLRGAAAFRGLAYHDYVGLRELLRTR